MMNEKPKYWVPALEKAHHVLAAIAAEPGALKLIDLSRRLEINKSSMFTMLATMESLGWVKREDGDTYAVGPALGDFGYAYQRSFDMRPVFREEASRVLQRLGESVQLAKRVQHEVLYLDKMEAPSPVRLVSEPGMRLPAHATALGKAMLAFAPEEEIARLLPETLAPLTMHTLQSRGELIDHLRQVRESGLAFDMQEAAMGFNCVAAPVFDREEEAAFAVSCSMPLHSWAEKQDEAVREIRGLAERLSGRM
ncbi:IclR family transcriptional regulator [Paenibacillus methanolicus]|uniref:IclR family KDG regulon transcriptional repressor n=1 Tax=Paenibacillus methanolicus TaxID=582686 RepID=A0A5S5BPN7_9BACL|nr:IclR family transcriptional regulator [Paenibacillus methanolicus]TYP68957.1 IclR family KDG regulon transcriptional repressor [Paenibacillus methanolicus]